MEKLDANLCYYSKRSYYFQDDFYSGIVASQTDIEAKE